MAAEHTDEMWEWMAVPVVAAETAEKAAAPAFDARQAVALLYTALPLGVYIDIDAEKFAVFNPDGGSLDDFELVKSAVSRVGEVEPEPLSLAAACSGDWIKVASTPAIPQPSGSPALRRLGEFTNFFPGTYPGGVPNHPGPVAGMLTGGLLGAGLGYGAGWLGEHLLPEKWQRGNLRNTLGVVGGLAGMLPGAAYMTSNVWSGRPANDPSALNTAFNAPPELGLEDLQKLTRPSGKYVTSCDNMARQHQKSAAEFMKIAAGYDADTFTPNEYVNKHHGPMDINVDAMGRTLWETGASPPLAGMTMGALSAAQQMPGGERPGFVTPRQMANLAANMGAGYLSGALVGGTLGILTGLPASTQETLRNSGMFLGILQAVVPKIFGD